MPELVFVYGALRRGASNGWRMQKARWLGAATVTGTLVKVDWYPGLILRGETSVKGEVYELDEALLGELDEFEGIGSTDEYERVRTKVILRDREVEVWLYQWLKGADDYRVVESGDWLKEG